MFVLTVGSYRESQPTIDLHLEYLEGRFKTLGEILTAEVSYTCLHWMVAK